MTEAKAEFSIDEIPTRPDIATTDAGVPQRLGALRLGRAHDEKLDAVLLEYLLTST